MGTGSGLLTMRLGSCGVLALLVTVGLGCADNSGAPTDDRNSRRRRRHGRCLIERRYRRQRGRLAARRRVGERDGRIVGGGDGRRLGGDGRGGRRNGWW